MNLAQSIKPVDYYSQIYSMVSYSFKNNTYHATKMNTWFFIRLLSFLTFATCFPLFDYVLYRNEYALLGLTLNTLHSMYYFMKLLVFIVAILLPHLMRKGFIDFLNSSIDLDATFEKLIGQKPCYRSLNKCAYFMIACSFLEGGLYFWFLVVDGKY